MPLRPLLVGSRFPYKVTNPTGYRSYAMVSGLPRVEPGGGGGGGGIRV